MLCKKKRTQDPYQPQQTTETQTDPNPPPEKPTRTKTRNEKNTEPANERRRKEKKTGTGRGFGVGVGKDVRIRERERERERDTTSTKEPDKEKNDEDKQLKNKHGSGREGFKGPKTTPTPEKEQRLHKEQTRNCRAKITTRQKPQQLHRGYHTAGWRGPWDALPSLGESPQGTMVPRGPKTPPPW